MPKTKPKWKLVTEFPVTEYRCGARAGERVRLRRKLVVRDHRNKPTGEVHAAGEVWTVVRGAAEEPRVLWLRQPDGTSATWSDDDDFWKWFESVKGSSQNTRKRPMKMTSLFLAIALAILTGCMTTQSRLDESQALRIGMSYVTLKGWEVANRVGSVTFRNWTGEWQMFFEIKDRPGLYTVFVNDKTKHVRHERGE